MTIAQHSTIQPVSLKSKDQKYSYTTVPTDPLGVRTYILENGLTVIITINKAEPRIQTFVPIKAGSKNDPADHTGLAHYLEHMMFKGTDKYGTSDFATEKIYLDQIDELYEQYNHTKDETERVEIYKKIDTVSGIAAKYAIANEYDKMATSLGATGTNAFTSVEETVYINNIPSNQLENWLIMESERFRQPVFRIFHTELEAVYEEKNRGLDNDDVKVHEAIMSGLFRKHPYGTQTTIGTIEHLKNPSLKKIKEYYNTYYVPNNMAVILAGDLDPDTAIELVDKYFGHFSPKPIPDFTFEPEENTNQPVIKNVVGPKAEEVDIAFRFPGAGTRESLLLRIANSVLFNQKAGLIDINLVKGQKLLDAGTYQANHKDYSYQFIQGEPATGQDLETVKDLLLGEIEKIKKGQFEESLVTAIINNMKLEDINNQENNDSRAFNIMDAFVTGRTWTDILVENELLKEITKQDVVDFANKWYTNDYVVVYKRTGEDKSIVKMPKPPITQVVINRDAISTFADMILHATATQVHPVFLDYETMIKQKALKPDLPIYYCQNSENERFTLYYFLDMGKDNDPRLPIAAQYLQFIGTDKYTADQISEEFYKLAANFGVSAGLDRTYIYLTGLQENFEASLRLFEHLLHNANPDAEVLEALISNILQERANQKMDKNVILNRAMVSYAKYGVKNPFNHNLSNDELKNLNAGDLVNYLHKLSSYKHKIYYYGPAELDAVAVLLENIHQTPETLNNYPEPISAKALTTEKNKVYFANFDMIQANIYWVSTGEPYSVALLPIATLFNEYFGGSMGSIVFQTLRESKALAYSTTSRYEKPNRRNEPFFSTAFIGTQADKIHDAIHAMNDLLHHIPTTDVLLENAKRGLKSQLEAQRIIRNDILLNFDQAMRMGNDHDTRKDIYENIDRITMDDIVAFHKTNFAEKKYQYCVLASREKIDLSSLTEYGDVEELTMEQLFGY